VTHTTTVNSKVEDGMTKYYAVCSCGWFSLNYNNSYYAERAENLHEGDFA